MLGAGCRAATTVAPLSISAPRSGSAATTCCAAVPRLGGSVPRPEAGGVQCDPVLRTVDGLGGTKARTDGTRSRPKRPILAVYLDVREKLRPRAQQREAGPFPAHRGHFSAGQSTPADRGRLIHVAACACDGSASYPIPAAPDGCQGRAPGAAPPWRPPRGMAAMHQERWLRNNQPALP